MKAIEYWYDDNCFCISQTDTATWIRGQEDDEYTFAPCNANPTIKLTPNLSNNCLVVTLTESSY